MGITEGSSLEKNTTTCLLKDVLEVQRKNWEILEFFPQIKGKLLKIVHVHPSTHMKKKPQFGGSQNFGGVLYYVWETCSPSSTKKALRLLGPHAEGSLAGPVL